MPVLEAVGLLQGCSCWNGKGGREQVIAGDQVRGSLHSRAWDPRASTGPVTRALDLRKEHPSGQQHSWTD